MHPRELAKLLDDPVWRLCNLYKILDKNGKLVLFTPNEVQAQFIKDIWYRNVVPKARQRGFSTVVQLMMLDACLFVENTIAGIIAQDLDTAKAIRNNKILIAYNNLPVAVRQMTRLTTKNIKELAWSNGSTMIIATSARGRTLQWLHVSEYGEICANNPEHAAEIRSGSLPAVDQHGIVVVESTAKGKEGGFYDMVMTAKAIVDAGKKPTTMDYKLHFASWWDAEEYETDPTDVIISQRDKEYFDDVETKIGRKLSARKRAWYVKKRDTDFAGDREMMWSQFPSTLDEAFQTSTDGVYLADQLALARRQDRIGKYPYDPAYPVYTFWDIGTNDDTAIWFLQVISGQDIWIDYEEASGEPPAYYVNKLREKKYVYGRHFLPHDAAHRRIGAESLRTYEDMLGDLHLENIEIVPRTNDLLAAITELRTDFATYHFDEAKCAEGIKHLENYRKDWNARQGVFMSTPRKNGHQHAADAIRQKAQYADRVRKVAGFNGGQSKPNRTGRRSGMAA